MVRQNRPMLSIRLPILMAFLLGLSMQLLMHHQLLKKHQNEYQPLGEPLDAASYSGISMGSKLLFSYLLAVRLQFHDNQAGRHIRYQKINYEQLVKWLNTIHQINPASEYPMFLASRVYSQTNDKAQLRIILEYIDRNFSLDPRLYWRHLAEGTVIAKHQLGDLEFALKMAEKLSNLPESVEIPRWARDMHFLLLAELNEYESTIAIIEALLLSDAIEDPDEEKFLREKLSLFQQKLFESKQNSNN